MHPIHTCTPSHSHVQPSHTHTILTHSDIDATGLDDLRQAVELINNNSIQLNVEQWGVNAAKMFAALPCRMLAVRLQ